MLGKFDTVCNRCTKIYFHNGTLIVYKYNVLHNIMYNIMHIACIFDKNETNNKHAVGYVTVTDVCIYSPAFFLYWTLSVLN